MWNDRKNLFRKPIVKTNMTQFFGEIPLAGEKDLFITKKYWLKKERRNLSFREIFDSPVSRLLRSEQLELAGIELIENTEEEILDITVEMDKRLKGTWESAEEDEALQERFWSIIMESDTFVDPPVSRIGATFILQNQYLLE
jgi:putative glycosyltransferase (TIGR04372 family)